MVTPKKPPTKPRENQPNSPAWTAPLAPPKRRTTKPDPFWRPKSRKYR